MSPPFCDLTETQPQTTDTARCLKRRYDAGVTPYGRATNSGVMQPLEVEKDARGGYHREVLLPTKVSRERGIRIMEENEVANTVNARDYKGFCNEEMTGVAHLRIPIREAVKSGYSEARVGGGRQHQPHSSQKSHKTREDR